MFYMVNNAEVAMSRHKNDTDFSQTFTEAHDKFDELAKQVQMKLSGMDRKKWDSYSQNVEAVFDVVSKKIDDATTRFHEQVEKGNYKEAAKSMGHTLQACAKGLKVAMVDLAESLGITRILRNLGIVKNSPNKIMDNLKKEVDKIGPTLVDNVKVYLDETEKDVKKFAKNTKKEASKLANKAKKSGKDAVNKAGMYMGF
jgi:gas vesicle protein